MENQKTFMKEIEDDTKKWKDRLYTQIGRVNIAKMAKLPKAIYRLNAILVKILMKFFTELEKIILIYVWKHKWPWVAKTILGNKNKIGVIMLPDFTLYYKSTVNKILWSLY